VGFRRNERTQNCHPQHQPEHIDDLPEVLLRWTADAFELHRYLWAHRPSTLNAFRMLELHVSEHAENLDMAPCSHALCCGVVDEEEVIRRGESF